MELKTDVDAAPVERLVMLPPVLDVCCGGRMMWFNPADDRGMFVDIRKETVQRSEAAQRKSFKALERNKSASERRRPK
jgi:hypothetical protein